MIIRKFDDYFLVKIYRENLSDFDVFDIDTIRPFFKEIFRKIKNKYNLKGLIDVDVYFNLDYGIIMEIHPVCDLFEQIDVKIHIYLNNVFLTLIDMNDIIDCKNVYYYKGNFYSNYTGLCDNEVFYKDTDNIINYGIKVC